MVSKIYLPIGAKRFLSRHAYRLAYRSQRDAAGFSRACNQRDRIASAKLKSDDLAFPLKPKWMRWKTFDRYMARHMALNQAMDAATIQRFGLSNFIM
ncbi:MAG: hypothetical protein KGQ46_07855 [Hyphomicrobiales bacterium]|nr:hypothetical protein [Hyphomicrobiales bacterium]MDE2116204.1 hypothetical protein [Hyphomicrobiales bacterium]